MNAPDPFYSRCSKPILPGTATRVAGRSIHMRCVARNLRLEALQQQSRSQIERRHARAATQLASEILDRTSARAVTCPICGARLAAGGSVVFQGDRLVHGGCWSPPAPRATPDA